MKRVLLISAVGLLLANSAMASMTNCRFALHQKLATTKAASICTTYSPNTSLTPCTSYVTQAAANGTGYHVYVVVGKAGSEGIGAASFGFDYKSTGGINRTGVSMTYCADGLSFPNDGGFGDFPQPKGGVRVTWNLPGSCQTTVVGSAGVHAVIGALYCYSYATDALQLTANNNLASGPELAVADCAGVSTDLIQIWGAAIASQLMGRVDFGGGAGYNPCIITPTMPTTWGKIKTQYAN